jgi:hypothetical protein
VTICWALVTPADPALAAEDEELAVDEEFGEVELLFELPLELHAASRAAAVTAAPGASQRFHLCVIAFGSSIPPITSSA